ncbi:MAG: nickel pincer cofactor biosynthesis protein LarC [Planctomycetota bacterium]|nr:nickel pincer cofactor biosynthesis protein LarC [Planctomycetota bacterium]
MSRVIYFDPIGGASGDMILGSLLAVGLELNPVLQGLNSLNLDNWSITPTLVQRGCFQALHAQVQCQDKAAHPPVHGSRNLSEIHSLIDQSSLPTPVKDRAKSVFLILGQSEATVHGLDLDKIHFHEVGATDSIIDIVAVVFGLHLLNIERVYCAPLTLGQGMGHSAHGPMPIPAPAVLEILSRINAPIAGARQGPERITPTAAALFAEYVEEFREIPAMELERTGVSAGTRINPAGSPPNVLRCFLGTQKLSSKTESVRVVQCNLDDQNPEIIGALSKKLFDEGCLDFFITPTQRKKNRPGAILNLLIEKDAYERFETILFRETSSFGLRYYDCHRSVLQRSTVPVQTQFGIIAMKLGWHRGELVTASPEFEDCQEAARKHSTSLKDVYLAAQVAWSTRDDHPQPPRPEAAHD